MKLNQTTAYAIAATAHIAAQPAGSLIPNSKICAATQMPERYILQLLRSLVNAGVLTSVRGVMGGYKLAKPANKITLLEIVEAIDVARTGEQIWIEPIHYADATELATKLSEIFGTDQPAGAGGGVPATSAPRPAAQGGK